jgi:hypothetical protein
MIVLNYAPEDMILPFGGKEWKFDPSGASTSQSFGFCNADLIFIFARGQAFCR